MSIGKVYRVRIDYESLEDVSDDLLNEFVYSNDVHEWDEFTGNAACSPYITFECENLPLAKKYKKAITRKLIESGCTLVT